MSGVLSSIHDLNSLQWTLPETRELLEKQLRLGAKKSKKNQPLLDSMLKVSSSNFFKTSIFLKEKSKESSNMHDFEKYNLVKRSKTLKPKSSTKLKPIDLDSDVPVKRWLAKNSLKALKLTILDALEPTLVKQTPEYVKILDKYVESKVWNDVSCDFFVLVVVVV